MRVPRICSKGNVDLSVATKTGIEEMTVGKTRQCNAKRLERKSPQRSARSMSSVQVSERNVCVSISSLLCSEQSCSANDSRIFQRPSSAREAHRCRDSSGRTHSASGESDVSRWHHRIIFGTRNMCMAEVYQKDDIGVLNRSILFRPQRQPIPAATLGPDNRRPQNIPHRDTE